ATGYDVASGRGSPIANLVIADLVAFGSTGGTGATTLSTPTLTGSAASTTTATLTWNSVSGASGYRVYQISGTTKTLLGTLSSTATSATITGLTAGSTDSFKVEAYNSTAIADSAVVTVTLPSSSKVTAPVVTAKATSTTTAQLSWSAVSGATGYRIYIWNG